MDNFLLVFFTKLFFSKTSYSSAASQSSFKFRQYGEFLGKAHTLYHTFYVKFLDLWSEVQKGFTVVFFELVFLEDCCLDCRFKCSFQIPQYREFEKSRHFTFDASHTLNMNYVDVFNFEISIASFSQRLPVRLRASSDLPIDGKLENLRRRRYVPFHLLHFVCMMNFDLFLRIRKILLAAVFKIYFYRSPDLNPVV